MSSKKNHWAQAFEFSNNPAPPTAISPIELLRAFAAGTCTADELSVLRTQTGQYLNGRHSTLDAALGLKGRPGQRRILSRTVQDERDTWLIQAAGEIGGTNWRRAGKLMDAIAVFDDICWPTWSADDNPPADTGAMRVALFRAFKISEEIPRGREQLAKILKRARELNSVVQLASVAIEVDDSDHDP